MTLRVTVEIVPFGDETQKMILDVMDISNITYEKSWENEYGRISDYVVRGHRREDGYWELIRKVLNESPPVLRKNTK